MMSVVKYAFALPACLALSSVAAPAVGQPTLPPLPGEGAPAVARTPPVAPAPVQQLYERVRRGVVAIERNGVPVAIGTVLGNDGRILTALSGLGGGEGADVRYADGTSVHAKVGHSDRDADLALLVPQAGRWTDGLTASEADPTSIDLRAMLPAAHGGHLGPAPAGVKGRVDAHARDGSALLQMLDVDLRAPAIAGAPLLDSNGSVVGVLVRACKGAPEAAADSPWAAWGNAQQVAKNAACSPVVLGAPVTAIRSFLSKTPANAAAPSPWLGIRGETESQGSARGVRITAVAPQSPAEKAGLKAAEDVIVAVDGQSVTSTDSLSQAIGKHAPGDAVKVLVFEDGKFREINVTLRAAP
jgi:serine protease Do